MRTAIAMLTGYILLLTIPPAVSAKSPLQWLRGLAHRVLALENRTDKLEGRVDELEQQMTHPIVMDSTGQVVGAFAGVGPNGAAIQIEVGGIIIGLNITETEILANGCNFGVYFESNNCSGPALIQTFRQPPALGGFAGRAFRCQVPDKGDTLYIQVPGPAITTMANSLIDLALVNPVCVNSSALDDYVTTVDYPWTILDTFVSPFSVLGVPGLPSP